MNLEPCVALNLFLLSCSMLVLGGLKRICEIDLGQFHRVVVQSNTGRSCSEDNCQDWFSIDYAFVCVPFFLLLSTKRFFFCLFSKVGGSKSVMDDAVSRHIPLVTDRPTIIFGADAIHTHPGEDSILILVLV